MDPNENIARQRELAENIVALGGSLEVRETDKPTRAVWHYADELAELVVALDEWRRKGGFDPYDDSDPLAGAPLNHIRALVNYNWQAEARDWQENDDHDDDASNEPAIVVTKHGDVPVWHIFQRMRIIDKWLQEVAQ